MTNIVICGGRAATDSVGYNGRTQLIMIIKHLEEEQGGRRRGIWRGWIISIR